MKVVTFSRVQGSNIPEARGQGMSQQVLVGPVANLGPISKRPKFLISKNTIGHISLFRGHQFSTSRLWNQLDQKYNPISAIWVSSPEPVNISEASVHAHFLEPQTNNLVSLSLGCLIYRVKMIFSILGALP